MLLPSAPSRLLLSRVLPAASHGACRHRRPGLRRVHSTASAEPDAAPPAPTPADTVTAAAIAAAAVSQPPLEPGLYVVPTPIGNLEDMSFRALRVLHTASAILAEDTRHTQKLLRHYGIRTPMLSFHAHNEKQREEGLLRRLADGEALALVSDAGTPAISDPGAALVAAAARAGATVVPLPGPVAATTALVASGLPTDTFLFCGFLPPKAGARQRRLQELSDCTATLVLYCSPHALGAALTDMVEEWGPHRRCSVARELTKRHEEHFRATLSEALEEFTQRREPRGEVCLVVAGREGGGPSGGGKRSPAAAALEPAVLRAALAQMLADGDSVSHASRRLAEALGVSRSTLYDLAREAEQQQLRQAAPGL